MNARSKVMLGLTVAVAGWLVWMLPWQVPVVIGVGFAIGLGIEKILAGLS